MKTISKILSIVLALTLVLGMAVMVSAAETTYTKIDRVADLTAGTYYMAGYLETYTNQGTTYDWAANPYHMFTGVSTDLFTTPYSYTAGVLTIKEGENYTAKTIELVAVSGKTNTYYVKYDGQYLYSSKYDNRKLDLTNTATEWVATDNSNGGITLTTTISEGQTVSLGTAGATSKLIRSYKSESTLKYGLVFFKEGAPSHEHDYTNATPTYVKKDHFKHTATTACAVNGCDNTKSADDYHNYENKKCADCGYEPAVASAATKTIAEALTIATAAGSNYSAELYTITGEIKSITSEKYGNMTITDGTNDLYIYGLYTPYEAARYDAMETKPQVGDTITILTVLGTHNDAPQAKSAWLTDHKVAEGEPEPDVTVKVENGTYVIVSGTNAVTTVAADKTYGYPGAAAVTVSGETVTGYLNANVFTIENTSENKFYIKDSAGRYVYLSGTHASINVSAELPTEGAEWALVKNGDDVVLKNVAKNKVMEYAESYGTFQFVQGADDAVKLYAAAINPDEGKTTDVPQTGDSAMIAPLAILMVLSAAGMAVMTIGKKKFF